MKRWNKNINIPNALSVLRIILIVPFVYFFMNGKILEAVACLVLSGLSDMFDGMIARKFNQFTELGKMLDPVADKMLTTAALLGFMQVGLCNIWIVMIVLTREFAVTSVRLIASAEAW